MPVGRVRLDDARAFQAGYLRRPGRGRIEATQLKEVCAVESRRPDLDQDLALSWHGVAHFAENRHVSPFGVSR